MENNKNYHKIFLLEKEKIKNSGVKPKLLLHACCGPCFTIPYELLKDTFDITIIYNNSNIFPENEFYRRRDELEKYIKDINANINVIKTEYNNDLYNQDLEPLGHEKEGRNRCRICFKKRLKEGFKMAQEKGYDYFGTVMTISRYKNAQDINKIGYELEKEFAPVKWLPADFKKEDGYEKSLIIIREHEMYFQEYCGCKYSFLAYQNRDKK